MNSSRDSGQGIGRAHAPHDAELPGASVSPDRERSSAASPRAMTDAERIGAYRAAQSLSFAVPDREADLVPFVMNFAQRIAAEPGRFGIEPNDARALLEQAEAYDAAYRRTLDDKTTTASARAVKMAARSTVKKTVRTHAQWIKAQPWISVEDKKAVGFVEGRH